MNVNTLTRILGINLKTKGFYYASAAINEAKKISGLDLKVTKDIYPVVAIHYGTTPEAVEHAIRTAIKIAWTNNKSNLEKIAGFKMKYCPSNKEFIIMMVNYALEVRER